VNTNVFSAGETYSADFEWVKWRSHLERVKWYSHRTVVKRGASQLL